MYRNIYLYIHLIMSPSVSVNAISRVRPSHRWVWIVIWWKNVAVDRSRPCWIAKISWRFKSNEAWGHEGISATHRSRVFWGSPHQPFPFSEGLWLPMTRRQVFLVMNPPFQFGRSRVGFDERKSSPKENEMNTGKEIQKLSHPEVSSKFSRRSEMKSSPIYLAGAFLLFPQLLCWKTRGKSIIETSLWEVPGKVGTEACQLGTSWEFVGEKRWNMTKSHI